jgi:hypothetical protein
MMRLEAVNSAIMEQGQNSSVFEADQLLAQTLAQLRPVYRQALIDVYGGDHKLIVAHPGGQDIDGLKLSDLDEERARDVLWMGVEFSSSSERASPNLGVVDQGLSELASALPFVLCSLLLVERFCDFHVHYFSIALDKKDAFDEVVQSLECLSADQRGKVASAMRVALMCYINYAMNEGLDDGCMLSKAGDVIIDLLYYIRRD